MTYGPVICRGHDFCREGVTAVARDDTNNISGKRRGISYLSK